MEIIIRQVVQDYIKTHAKSNKGKEIFGWLVGSEDKKKEKLFVECVISSHRYMTQNVIAAEPDLTETGIISSVLPAGLGIIGMYHSHPVNVFHSSIDDRTLAQLTILYPYALSIITNGDTIIAYRLGKSDDNRSRGVETSYKTVKTAINSFKQIIFEIKGEINFSQIDFAVNDIIASIEKRMSQYLEKKDFSNEILKAFRKNNHIIKINLENVYPVGVEDATSDKSFQHLTFNFKSIIDASSSLIKKNELLQQVIANSLRMNILTQLKSLRIDKERKKIIVSERQSISFQDIPLHVYLDQNKENTPMHQFVDDMKIRLKILEGSQKPRT